MNKRNLKALQEARSVAREPYAWPGGYPRFLVTSDGGCLCPACVRREFHKIASAAMDNRNDGWKPQGSSINYEDKGLVCDHCNRLIPSAYGGANDQA
jgi:hypothetical protein